MATANRQLTDYELLVLKPKRQHVNVVVVKIIFCEICKVGNRIIEGQRCGICDKLKEK